MAMGAETTTVWINEAREQAARKVSKLAERVGSQFPHASRGGTYSLEPPEWWTSGFWPGLLWLVWRQTKDEKLAVFAREAENALEQLLLGEGFYGFHHDVGFQFQPTAVMRYKLTGDRDARRRGLLAVALLMNRFNPAGQVIEAWNGEGNVGKVIIDSFMNMPLLFWAYQETGVVRFRNLAETHLNTALHSFIRADATTYHILRFDPETGEQREAQGGQGYAPESAWSRGQSWAIYGLSLAYRYTKNTRYRDAALRVADNFITALPDTGVPPWDFRAPDVANAPRDSSAGAIVASGLFELASLLEGAKALQYRNAALKLLSDLNTHCATWNDANEEGLLRHATGNLPAGQNVDVSLIYGDYYFLEALGKAAGDMTSCW
ncbi:MAG: glycoside hydrolase family 88 protein [Trueperaceae bacterium]